ncbi:hypothetical protein GA0061096_3266 [Fictibacillus enclensis]|nr:hypothetical protein GA0061096_3266 [Fictibacillus enclensis]
MVLAPRKLIYWPVLKIYCPNLDYVNYASSQKTKNPASASKRSAGLIKLEQSNKHAADHVGLAAVWANREDG